MATKSSKRTTKVVETSMSSSSSTPGLSSSSRPGSPLSPTRTSRLQEKSDLQNLNNRLATYIDRVRQLEHENTKLYRQIQSSEETTTREVSNIKEMYENELNQTRVALDSLAKEKAKLEIDTKRMFEENADLKNRYVSTVSRGGARVPAVGPGYLDNAHPHLSWLTCKGPSPLCSSGGTVCRSRACSHLKRGLYMPNAASSSRSCSLLFAFDRLRGVWQPNVRRPRP